jgi:hypothetical protein
MNCVCAELLFLHFINFKIQNFLMNVFLLLRLKKISLNLFCLVKFSKPLFPNVTLYCDLSCKNEF